MRVLGIDLSSQPKNTALCSIEYNNGKLRAEPPLLACDDSMIELQTKQVDAIGIDAPLGWPQAFKEAVQDWDLEEWNPEVRDQMRYRVTDIEVKQRTGLHPLSVSTDRISLPAMRAMALLYRKKIRDKSGGEHYYEVYPAGTLLVWNLPYNGYKGTGNQQREKRRVILQKLREKFPTLSGVETYSNTDHALDALLAALTTVAAVSGKTLTPSADQLALAKIEGWIHLPCFDL